MDSDIESLEIVEDENDEVQTITSTMPFTPIITPPSSSSAFRLNAAINLKQPYRAPDAEQYAQKSHVQRKRKSREVEHLRFGI